MLLTLSLIYKCLMVLVPLTILNGIFTYGRIRNRKKLIIFLILMVVFFIFTILLNIQSTFSTVYSLEFIHFINKSDLFSIFMYVILGMYFYFYYKFSKIKIFIFIFIFNMYMDITIKDVLLRYIFFLFNGKDISVSNINFNKFDSNLTMLKSNITVYFIILIVYLFIYNVYRFLDKRCKLSDIVMKSYVYIFIIFIINFICILLLAVLRKFDSVKFLGVYVEAFILRDFVLKYLIYANIISNICILIDIVKRNKINAQNKSIETRLDAQLSHYAEVKETHLKVRKLYHDINNHICCLENLNTSNEETNTYINNLKSEIIDFKKIYDTGNLLLDTIVNEKSSVCEKKGIDFSCNVDFSKIDFLEPIDISAIFANILDNAIEACEKIHRIEAKKYVKIRGTINRSFYIIKCENSKANEILLEKNRLLTSKANKFVHGLGILSIESSLKKYNGNLDLKEFEGDFRAIIYIPLNEDEREVEV